MSELCYRSGMFGPPLNPAMHPAALNPLHPQVQTQQAIDINQRAAQVAAMGYSSVSAAPVSAASQPEIRRIDAEQERRRAEHCARDRHRLAAAARQHDDVFERLVLVAHHWLPDDTVMNRNRGGSFVNHVTPSQPGGSLAGQRAARASPSGGRSPIRVADPELWSEALPLLFPNPADIDLNQPPWPTPEIIRWFVRQPRATGSMFPLTTRTRTHGWVRTKHGTCEYFTALHSKVTFNPSGKIVVYVEGVDQVLSYGGLQEIAHALGLHDPAMEPTPFDPLSSATT